MLLPVLHIAIRCFEYTQGSNTIHLSSLGHQPHGLDLGGGEMQLEQLFETSDSDNVGEITEMPYTLFLLHRAGATHLSKYDTEYLTLLGSICI